MKGKSLMKFKCQIIWSDSGSGGSHPRSCRNSFSISLVVSSCRFHGWEGVDHRGGTVCRRHLLGLLSEWRQQITPWILSRLGWRREKLEDFPRVGKTCRNDQKNRMRDGQAGRQFHKQMSFTWWTWHMMMRVVQGQQFPLEPLALQLMESREPVMNANQLSSISIELGFT